MNQFKRNIEIKNKEYKKNHQTSFYKTYEKSKGGRKVYKGSIVKQGEFNFNEYLSGVSCFVINDEGRVLVEKRANTKLTPNALDLISGHIDNNETPTQAMLREYIEEVHNGDKKEQQEAIDEVKLNLKKLDELDLIFEKNRKFFIQFFALETKMKKLTRQAEEVDSMEWIPMEELFEMIRQGKTKFPYDKRFEKIFEQVRENHKKNKKIQEREL